MGQFSWVSANHLMSKSGLYVNEILLYDAAVLLIPKEFGGGYIIENTYDGYGHFGDRDAYGLIAEWNQPEDYIDDNTSRDIGIKLSIDDEKHVQLKYPLKIISLSEDSEAILETLENGELTYETVTMFSVSSVNVSERSRINPFIFNEWYELLRKRLIVENYDFVTVLEKEVAFIQEENIINHVETIQYILSQEFDKISVENLVKEIKEQNNDFCKTLTYYQKRIKEISIIQKGEAYSPELLELIMKKRRNPGFFAIKFLELNKHLKL